jgi:ubiquinone/menaquinone biosynthesis C-methylase UbiE
MSAVARVYDDVAHTYDSDFCQLYEHAHNRVIDQLNEHVLGQAGQMDQLLTAGAKVREGCVGHALDLAGGTGQFWHRLRGQLSWQSLTINDVSSSMLACAKQKLPTDTHFMQGDLGRILEAVLPERFDLVTSHFLFSFVCRKRIFETAHRLLRRGGVFSIATTTQQDLKALYTGRFKIAGHLFRVERYVSRAHTPQYHGTLHDELASAGFEVISHAHLKSPIVLNRFEDVRAWALDSGWAASFFERFPRLKMALTTGAFRVAERVMHPLYPITAHSDMSLYLVRKL